MNNQELVKFYTDADMPNAVVEFRTDEGLWIPVTSTPSSTSNTEDWRVIFKSETYVDLTPFINTKILCRFFDEGGTDSYLGFITGINEAGYMCSEFAEPFKRCELVEKFWNNIEDVKIPEGLNGLAQVKSGAVLHISKLDSWNNVISYSCNGLTNGFEYKGFGNA